MDVTTIITDYLHLYKSFIVKSESGYYFPCWYAFISGEKELSFVKGLNYKNRQVGCTKINILTEESDFNTDTFNGYRTPTEPFEDWDWIENLII